MEQISTSPRHPILGCADEIEGALESVAQVAPEYMTTADKAEALLKLTRLQSRLESLTLKVAAAADDVAKAEGARGIGSWLNAHAMTGQGAGLGAERLARDLDTKWQEVAAAFADGRLNSQQVGVIVRTLNGLAAETCVDAETLAMAETRLVEYAAELGPRELTRLGDRILEIIAPDIHEGAEREKLEREQRRANSATRLSFRKRGDGATDISARVPDSVASRLKAYLDAFTSPRRPQPTDSGGSGPLTDPATGERLPADRLRGHAFCALLEALDPKKLPQHGGNATTLVVTIDWEALRSGIGAATLADGTRITVGETRRLGCRAGFLPAVLGTDSEILDLGRTARLFSAAQHRALSIRHRTCQGEGCDVPAAWCEAHHGDPWHQQGRTDLSKAWLLCSWHHHRVHDPEYLTEFLPNGDVRFSRRT